MLPAQALKISVHYIDTVVLMSNDGLSFQICKTSDDSESLRNDRRAVVEGLIGFNKNKTGCAPEYLWVLMRDKKSRVVGGLLGYTFGDWMHIEILWVEESFRNKDNGTKLLKMAENEAVKRGCKHVDLDTMSWQAKPFYEKHSYTLFAKLDNYPEGHSKYFMKKDLP
jgi:GNAT superfamily N-acetyltransferase